MSEPKFWHFIVNSWKMNENSEILTLNDNPEYIKSVNKIVGIKPAQITVITSNQTKALELADSIENKVIFENSDESIKTDFTKTFNCVEMVDKREEIEKSVARFSSLATMICKDDSHIKATSINGEFPDLTPLLADFMLLRDCLNQNDSEKSLEHFIKIFYKIKVPWATEKDIPSIISAMTKSNVKVPIDVVESTKLMSDGQLLQVAKAVTYSSKIVKRLYDQNRAFQVSQMILDLTEGNEEIGVYGRCKKYMIKTSKTEAKKAMSFLADGPTAPGLVVFTGLEGTK